MNPTWHSSRGSLFCGFYKNERPPPQQDGLVPYSPGTHIPAGEKVDAKINKVINFRSRQMLRGKNGDESGGV